MDIALEWVMLLEDGEIKGDFEERLNAVQALIDDASTPGDSLPMAFILLSVLGGIVILTDKIYVRARGSN